MPRYDMVSPTREEIVRALQMFAHGPDYLTLSHLAALLRISPTTAARLVRGQWPQNGILIPADLLAACQAKTKRNRARGVEAVRKLDAATAVEIRVAYANGVRIADLSRRYGVSRGVLWALLIGKTYQPGGLQ